MIHGVVQDSRYLGSEEGFHLSIYMVNVSGPRPSEEFKWVSVYVVASCDDVEYGVACVEKVPHSVFASGHAFNRVEIESLMLQAIADAEYSLSIIGA